MGGADNVQASNIANTDQKRDYYGTYFQDDFKVTPKLTVNLGLRWEYFGQLVERYGAQSNFLPSGNSSPSQFLLTKRRCDTPLSPEFIAATKTDNINIVCSGVAGLGHSQLANFAPRVGFAYHLTPKLVVRGGYGIFYGGFENSTVETYVDFPFQYGLSYGNLTPDAPITFPNGKIGTLENGLSAIPLTSAAVQPAGVSFTGEDFHSKTPYTQGYNLTVQYQLSTNDTVQAGYVGNTVRHLGPSQFYGPGFHRLDFSLFKAFPVTEKSRIEFRAEIFNLTNTPNFSLPGFGGNGVSAAPGSLDYTSDNFGKITSTRDGQNDQREIQFALKFYF